MTHTEREPAAAGAAAASNPSPAAPPARQRTTPASRVEGLPPAAIRCLQRTSQALEKRDLDAADEALREAAAIAPEHPEILRLTGVVAYLRGRFVDAIGLQRRVLSAWPDDALALGNLGTAYADHGRVGDALFAFRRAAEVAPDQAAAWFNLGKLLDSQAHVEEAEKALSRALALAPRHLSARIAHANALATLGDTTAAAAEYRAAIAQEPRAVQAWLGLANLKIVRLDAAESAALERLHGDPALPDAERAVAGFALGKVLEDEGRYAEAFDVLAAANAARRPLAPWDATRFSREVDAIEAAFSPAIATATNPKLGEEVVFIVSLPRAGSTLVEQILAAHPEIEGASELPDLEAVILEESTFRRQRFPEWIASATPADWQRMGERYLHRTRRWREKKPRFTDKMPDNWLLAGAALAMLPGARVVNVRRDAVETCWSCFKQLFGAGRHGYSYDLSDLAETWRDYDRLSAFWSRRFPERVREQSYEQLVAEPEAQTRALLDFLGVPFDAACLDFHAAARSVRTASASQVREPIRRGTARSAAYGARLDPLRRMLASERAAAPGDVEKATPAQRADRVQGLDDDSARDLLRAAALLSNGRVDEAAALVERVRALHPEHGETLRLAGVLDSARGRHAQALATLARASAAKPDDALILNTLGTAQAAAGDDDAALASFTRAVVLDPRAANARYNLGAALAARGDFANARDAFALALEVDPALTPARLALADALRALGDDDGAVAAWRELLAQNPDAVAAWQGLAELRPGELTAAERTMLEGEYQRVRRPDTDRASLAYALANVLQARAQYREAFATFATANALRRRDFEWDAARHSQRCAQILDAFAAEAARASDDSLGTGCVFVLGLPDAIADAVARALRAHPSVARGADPSRVIAAESATRGQRFVQWAKAARPNDWQRIGRAYLASNPGAGDRTHRVVDAQTVAVEHAGAIAAMLPGARFVVVDNDAIESGFDLFRRDFRARERYRCDFAELAAYRHDQQRLLQRWSERFGDRIVRVDAAALEATVTQLFATLGLGAPTAPIDLASHVGARRYGDLVRPLARMLDAQDAAS